MASMQFCRECNNLLYPKENRLEKRLYFACRNCPYKQEADTTCVYVNDIKQATTGSLNIHRDIILDPSLKRTHAVRCSVCGGDESCFFARSDEKMELVFICTNPDCAHWWIQSTTTGKEEEKK